MRFKDLAVGQRFQFKHTLRYAGLEHGPWIKRSTRTYYKHTTPFGTDEQAQEHSEWNGLHCEVGTINVEVEGA